MIKTLKFSPVRIMARAAIVASLYAALTMILPFSYGSVQFRVSEAMCILPLFFPESVLGLFVGCVVSNLITPNIPVLDIVFGSTATLAAAALTAMIGNIARKSKEKSGSAAKYRIPLSVKLLAPLPAVIINAVVVGAVITVSIAGTGNINSEFWNLFLLNSVSVGAGEAGVCYILGVPLIYVMEKIYYR